MPRAFAFERSNILSPAERAEAARKCLRIISEDADLDKMKRVDYEFYNDQMARSKRISYAPSESVLAWLRDITERVNEGATDALR